MHGTLAHAHTVELDQFYPDVTRNITIPRSPELFLPDQWTRVFAKGLLTHAFAGRKVLEVGVGTGINMAGLLAGRIPPSQYVGTDICNNAVSASRILATAQGWDAQLVQSNLLEDVPDDILSRVDHIIACIPQVPSDKPLGEGDNYAHYYKANGSYWDQYGLGLNSRLLKQAWERAPQASVTLNLSGRPGLDKLKELFDYHDRFARVAYEELVPQHTETSIESLAKMEQDGHAPFEFFADADGVEQIGATQAEVRRVNQEPVFHKVYVLSASPR
jgi:methylase of polypeptide subunit release factors